MVSFSSPSSSTTTYQTPPNPLAKGNTTCRDPRLGQHQLLTVPPALLPLWGLWDSKPICFVVSVGGLLPVVTIPALVAPPFAAVPAVTVIAVPTARISEVPALPVAMVVAVAALSVAVNVTVATTSIPVALHVVVATTSVATARGLVVPTGPAVVVSFPDHAATTTTSGGNTGAAALSTVGAGTCAVEALSSDTWEGGNGTQTPRAGEAWHTLCCCGGCKWALRVCSVLLG